MDLLLFCGPKHRFFVVGEPRAEQHAGAHSLARGFLHETWQKVHSAYEVLKQRFDPQENVCAALRHAKELRIHHGTSLSADTANGCFQDFLSKAETKHRRWMCIDLCLALFGSLLTPIPGPNVFFFYPAVRALSHYFAMKGTQTARQVELLSFSVESKIDLIIGKLDRLDLVQTDIVDLEEKYSVHHLRSLLDRL
jgi:hypothetical protein